MAQKNNLPPFPTEFPHIFVEIAWPLVPEVSYADLVYLSQLVKQVGKEKTYESLVDSLRKIQWTKIAGQEAIAIERQIAEQVNKDAIPFNPVRQVQYSKNLFDFIANGKAALDSAAVFLNTFLNLNRDGPERDFRKVSFCQIVCSYDTVIGKHIKTLAEWLDKDRRTSDSIVATRDEWLHRGRPAIVAIFPPTELGYFPIPKALTLELPSPGTPLTGDYYYKTQEFIEFHLQKLFALFMVIVKRCIDVEEKLAPKHIQRDSLPVTAPLSVFPLRATMNSTINKIRLHL